MDVKETSRERVSEIVVDWHKWKKIFAAFGGDEENFCPFPRVFINKSAEKREFLPNFAQKNKISLEIAKKM